VTARTRCGREFTKAGREWLGRRDSNPDTQIQSPYQSEPAQQNQQGTAAKIGEVRQQAQYGRNTDCCLQFAGGGTDGSSANVPASNQEQLLGSEEDTLL
jgi:hypothetical protein